MNKNARVRRQWVVSSALVILLSLLPLASACGDDDSPNDQLCDGLDELRTAIKSIQDVEPESAREDLQDIRMDVQDALTDIQESASQIPEIQALRTSIDDFRTAVEGLGPDVSPGQAIRTLGGQIVSLSAAVSEARAADDC